MARSSSRNSGFSRKAQFSLFTGYLAAFLGAVIGLALLIVSIWQPQSFAGLRGLANDATRPAGQGTAVVRDEGQGFFESVQGYLEAGSQNSKLKQELEVARIRLKESDDVAQENAQLRGLLGLQELEQPPIVTTRLIGSSSTSARRFAYMAAGRNQGVGNGMPVRSERGIVGRVLETSRNTARVLLLTDSASALPVRRSTDNVVALARGRGDGLLQIRLINLGLNPLEVGDLLVTSGTGGYFQPGVAVAIVQELNDEGALARLVADPVSTNFVAVTPIWQPEAVYASQVPEEEPLVEPEPESEGEGNDAENANEGTPGTQDGE
jgi:rod shape-determining protein MreC